MLKIFPERFSKQQRFGQKELPNIGIDAYGRRDMKVTNEGPTSLTNPITSPLREDCSVECHKGKKGRKIPYRSVRVFESYSFFYISSLSHCHQS